MEQGRLKKANGNEYHGWRNSSGTALYLSLEAGDSRTVAIEDGDEFSVYTEPSPADVSDDLVRMAAPELLEALRTLREDMRMLRDGEWDGDAKSAQASMDVADAAIAKAEGRV